VQTRLAVATAMNDGCLNHPPNLKFLILYRCPVLPILDENLHVRQVGYRLYGTFPAKNDIAKGLQAKMR
jgi:hypothetical protein